MGRIFKIVKSSDYQKYGEFESPILLYTNSHEDKRGFIYELYREDEFMPVLNGHKFICDKLSFSSHPYTLRGLHYNHSTYKLMHVIVGASFNVAVDMREKSPRYLQYESFYLNDLTFNFLLVPPGFANGFLTLEKDTIIEYKLTEYYENYTESGIKWNDPRIKIQWPFKDISGVVISDKDR